MDFSGLLTKFLIFIVLMLIGYLYARRRVVGPEFAKGGSKLTLDVFMSASILNSVIANPPQMTGGELWRALWIMSFGIVLAYLLAAALVRVLPGRRDDAPLELLMAVPNSMFIALPVVQQVLGAQAVLYVALSNIPFNVLLYTYGVWRLKKGGGAMRLRDFFSVPLAATFLSVLIFALRVSMPQPVKELVGAMAGATMPLSMVVIGASLGGVNAREALCSGHAYLSSAVKLLAAPLLVYFATGLVTADRALLMTATIVAASPSGIIVSVLAMQYGRDAVYTSKAILTSTVLSMVTIPAIVWLLMR